MNQIVPRWLPALLMMAIIFWFSSQPSDAFFYFGRLDVAIKKTGHAIGYAILAASYWYGLEFRRDRRWIAWMLAVLYAVTDEIHQSFVPGRHPSVWDVVIYDNLGALICIWLGGKFTKQKKASLH